MKNIHELFKPKDPEKNVIPGYEVTIEMDENDGDYKSEVIRYTEEDWANLPDILLWAICYFGHGYTGKFANGETWGDYYGHHWERNEHGLSWLASDIMSENDMMLYSDWGECHSYSEISIKYQDSQGLYHDVSLPDIDELFETEEEMIEFLTNLYEEYRGGEV